MKYLSLLRHAKSSWDFPSLDDKHRPLSKRGKKSTQLIAEHNSNVFKEAELICASTSVRATQTIENILEHAKISASNLEFREQLYTFDDSDIIRFIQSISDSYQRILLVGHNPAFTEVVNQLTNNQLINIPTCGIVKIQCESISWQDITQFENKLVFFDCPKNYASK
ncbi:SixA phosphatase family protein [Pleionea sediminis]|uniref:SixA phosphatase family protein n=1 Tax=Pleionea sediminis TaxID=2569479 RepID=UPI0013DDE838|nr:histidine phosphatase family protein [Pleionea sediminis]